MAQTATIKLGEPKQEIERLQQILSNLQIRVSQDVNGGNFTVCTESEPLFCFDRPTKRRD